MRFDVRRVEMTPSTNDEVKKAALSGAAEGVAIVASNQTSGRGRHGRGWQFLSGNLAFSVLLRPPLPVSLWGCYSFAVSVAVGDALCAYLPEDAVQLKWPNDVLVNGKKICGILLEAGEGWLVAGIGVNVRQVPRSPRYPSTSLLSERAEACSASEVMDGILSRLGFWYECMNKEGFAPVRKAWLARARKGLMHVRIPTEAQEIHGEFADLDENGNLRLWLQDGSERRVSAGDVFF